MDDIRPIRTEADYNWALAEIERYFIDEPEADTPDADRFDVLAGLIEAYEAKEWSIELAHPVDVIKYVMQARGLDWADLAELLGSRSHASEVLHMRRRLSLAMVRKITDAWHIPADILVRPYQTIAQPRAASRRPKAAARRAQLQQAAGH